MDELDDEFGKPVGRCGFTSEEKCTRCRLYRRVRPQPVVQHHDAQRIEQLAFVFVDPFDLGVEHRVRVQRHAVSRLQPGRAARLGLALGVSEEVPEAFVIRQEAQPVELIEVGDPGIADGLADHRGERRVGEHQPASGGDTIGLVAEAFGKQFSQVPDRGRSQQLGMNLRHAVRAVGADDGQVGHADLLCRAFLDQAHPLNAALVARESRAHEVDQAPVDFKDDLQVPWQQRLEPGHGPFLEGFRQQRVVGVRQRSLCEAPGLIPFQVCLVQQEPHELGNGNRGVRVVELDSDFLGQRVPIVVVATKPADEVREGTGDQEIFLHETQTLPPGGRVIRIEYAGQARRLERLRDRTDELAVAEFLEIKIVRGTGSPEAQRVDRPASVTHDRPIVGYADEVRRLAHDRSQVSAADLIGAIEPDCHFLVRPGHLPRVLAAQPVVGLFLLPAIPENLPEHAVLVAQSITHGRQLQRRHGFEKTGGQASESAVTQSGVRFLFQQGGPVESLVLGSLLRDRIQQQIGYIVGERAANQELHGQVVDALGIRLRVGALGVYPALREDVAHRAREGLESLARPGGRRVHDGVEYEMSLVAVCVRQRPWAARGWSLEGCIAFEPNR